MIAKGDTVRWLSGFGYAVGIVLSRDGDAVKVQAADGKVMVMPVMTLTLDRIGNP